MIPRVSWMSRFRLACFGRSLVTDATTTSRIAKPTGTEHEHRMRVRRARPADAPRVLRFVRLHAGSAWPYLAAAQPNSAAHLIVKDYASRTLAQGHSMLAEQYETKRGWARMRGLALNTVVCPWDSVLLQRWAACVRCPQSRQFLSLSAECLREPCLFEKYKLKSIMQITLLVPPDTPRSSEIIKILTKNSMQRAQDVGFALLRFDISTDEMEKALNELKLKREWQLKTEETKRKASIGNQKGTLSVYTGLAASSTVLVK